MQRSPSLNGLLFNTAVCTLAAVLCVFVLDVGLAEAASMEDSFFWSKVVPFFAMCWFDIYDICVWWFNLCGKAIGIIVGLGTLFVGVFGIPLGILLVILFVIVEIFRFVVWGVDADTMMRLVHAIDRWTW
ncbi:MAG: hypothetical protein LBR38_03690 [Synergistaceae bacterium]|jgi:hypothetical protein|nr:hypothetical protein [Synergistaceae bacterium]